MYSIVLHKKALECLNYLRNYDHKTHQQIIDDIILIEINGSNFSGTKNIGDNIYRKRSGRRRILRVYGSANDIHIRLIAIEKDTNKDYKIWKSYILNNI